MLKQEDTQFKMKFMEHVNDVFILNVIFILNCYLSTNKLTNYISHYNKINLIFGTGNIHYNLTINTQLEIKVTNFAYFTLESRYSQKALFEVWSTKYMWLLSQTTSNKLIIEVIFLTVVIFFNVRQYLNLF